MHGLVDGRGMDVTMKVKHSEDGPTGAHNFEISLVNLMSGETGRLYMPGSTLRSKKREFLSSI